MIRRCNSEPSRPRNVDNAQAWSGRSCWRYCLRALLYARRVVVSGGLGCHITTIICDKTELQTRFSAKKIETISINSTVVKC